MSISNVHIYYPSIINPDGSLTAQTVTWYDLRRVVSVAQGKTVASTTTVNAYVEGLTFDGQYQARNWPQTQFETAKLASLAAEAATGD